MGEFGETRGGVGLELFGCGKFLVGFAGVVNTAEPSSYLLLGTGMLCLVGISKRKDFPAQSHILDACLVLFEVGVPVFNQGDDGVWLCGFESEQEPLAIRRHVEPSV